MGEERWSVWVEDRTSSSLGVTSENQRASDGHESHCKIGALGYVMQGPLFPYPYCIRKSLSIVLTTRVTEVQLLCILIRLYAYFNQNDVG